MEAAGGFLWLRLGLRVQRASGLGFRPQGFRILKGVSIEGCRAWDRGLGWAQVLPPSMNK